jgi:hypothetical protein
VVAEDSPVVVAARPFTTEVILQEILALVQMALLEWLK